MNSTLNQNNQNMLINQPKQNCLSFKIFAINVNSIISHERRYELIQSIKNYKPNIVLLNETKLYGRHKLQIDGFNVFRVDRYGSEGGGGTAVLIKNDICLNITQVFSPSPIKNKILEYTIVKIVVNKNTNLFIISLYANTLNYSVFINELNEIFSKLKLDSLNNYFVLAGDLNARHTFWGDKTCNFKGYKFKEWESTFSHLYKANIIPPSTPTFPRAESFLDFCILDARLMITDLTDNKLKTVNYDSDHKGLLFTVKIALEVPIDILKFDHKYVFKKTKWSKFQSTLLKKYKNEVPYDRNLSIEEINFHINCISQCINEAIAECVPKYTPNCNTINYVNNKITSLHKTKSKCITFLNNLRNSGLPNHNPQITNIKNIIKLIKSELKTEFQKTYLKYWEKEFQKIDHKITESFFPKINSFFRRKPPPEITNLNIDVNETSILNRINLNPTSFPIIDNKIVVDDPIDKLNIMGAFYESINSPRHTNINTQIKKDVDNFTTNFINDYNSNKFKPLIDFSYENPSYDPSIIEINNLPYFYSFGSIKYIFKKLPNKTSAGIDKIPPIVLKNLPLFVIYNMASIFNQSLNLSYFPDCWKTAKVLPLPKKDKDHSNPTNYRPISLTPSLSKAYEMLIEKSIRHFSDREKIIPDNQFGFKYKHSTCHAINKLLSDINTSLNNNKIVGACLIDVAKAFDSVWIFGLLYILNKFNCPKYLLYLTWNMLSDKKFLTYDGKNLSSFTFSIIEGLQQGTVTSPLLFNIFNYQVLQLIDTIEYPDSYSLAFADDYIVYVIANNAKEVQDKLQVLVNKVYQHYITLNLKPNASKSETILFHKPLRFISQKLRDSIKNFQISIISANDENTKIDHKKSVKYLGVHYLLRLNDHVKIQLEKATKAFKKYCRLFMCKNLHPRAKIICYLLLIRPIITYACPVWWNISASLMEKVRKFERSCIRMCLHKYRQTDSKKFISNNNLYNEASIPRIDSFIIKLSRDYYNNNIKINNDLIQSFAQINQQNILGASMSGYIPPQYFIYYDKAGIIQDHNNTPLIYHIPRHQSNKKLPYSYNDIDVNNLVYSTSLPLIDINNCQRVSRNYWWLSNNDIHLDEIRKRSRFKN